MTKRIEKKFVNEAKQFRDEGDVHSAWKALAEGGDNYARNAAEITGGDDVTLSKELVKETWIKANEFEKFNKYFDDVAIHHLSNYIEAIEKSESNQLPDTYVIEQSYADALTSQSVSVNAAVDAIINTLVEGTWLPGWTAWLDLFDGRWSDKYDIDSSRISDDMGIESEYTRSEALVKISQIGMDASAEFARKKINAAVEDAIDVVFEAPQETVSENIIYTAPADIPSAPIVDLSFNYNVPQYDLGSSGRDDTSHSYTSSSSSSGYNSGSLSMSDYSTPSYDLGSSQGRGWSSSNDYSSSGGSYSGESFFDW